MSTTYLLQPSLPPTNLPHNTIIIVVSLFSFFRVTSHRYNSSRITSCASLEAPPIPLHAPHVPHPSHAATQHDQTPQNRSRVYVGGPHARDELGHERSSRAMEERIVGSGYDLDAAALWGRLDVTISRGEIRNKAKSHFEKLQSLLFFGGRPVLGKLSWRRLKNVSKMLKYARKPLIHGRLYAYYTTCPILTVSAEGLKIYWTYLNPLLRSRKKKKK